MTLRKATRSLVLCAGLSLALAGMRCGGGGSSSNPPPGSITVTISPTTLSLFTSGTKLFSATVAGTSNASVTWSVNGVAGGDATVGTITSTGTSTGFYTAPDLVPSPDTVTVTATSQANSSRSASAKVTIKLDALILSALDPIVAMQGSGALTLTVAGTGFIPGSQVVFNGAARQTTFVKSTQLKADILPGDISSPGTFLVRVQSSRGNTTSESFYVVPNISQRAVTVNAGAASGGIDISVPPFASPTLSIIAVGTGNSAGGTGVEVRQGNAVTLFLVGPGLTPGTFYIISGDSNGVTVRQPLASAFSETTTGTPAVDVRVTVGASAALGPRNIVVTNPAREVTAFVGGLLVTPAL